MILTFEMVQSKLWNKKEFYLWTGYMQKKNTRKAAISSLKDIKNLHKMIET
jgi:hypothetical protein